MSDTMDSIALPENDLGRIARETMAELRRDGKLPSMVTDKDLDLVNQALYEYRLWGGGASAASYLRIVDAMEHVVNFIEKGSNEKTYITPREIPPHPKLAAELRDAHFVDLAKEKAQAEWARQAQQALLVEEAGQETPSQAVPDKTPSSERKK